jgi:3-ketosteroid 9alpha-monooxygenase subunit B
MTTIHHIRIYYAILAILAIASYATGEFGIIHVWLGYGVTVVIILRVIWAFTGDQQVSLKRFNPSFAGINLTNFFTHPLISRVLMLLIAICLIGVSVTGLIMDKGRAIGIVDLKISTNAFASQDHDDHKKNHRKDRHENKDDYDENLLSEAHELLANLMLLIVGIHVTYLFLFKRYMAKFMLFIPNKKT